MYRWLGTTDAIFWLNRKRCFLFRGNFRARYFFLCPEVPLLPRTPNHAFEQRPRRVHPTKPDQRLAQRKRKCFLAGLEIIDTLFVNWLAKKVILSERKVNICASSPRVHILYWNRRPSLIWMRGWSAGCLLTMVYVFLCVCVCVCVYPCGK